MADDRPADDDLATVVAELRRELDDVRSTTLARASRSATGDIEPTLRTTPKPDTLLLQGQTVNRADYPGLWQWIVDNGLSPSVFGAGNGTTTFVLPDYRGRVMAGATATRPVGTLYGAATRVITPENMAAHTHQVSVKDHMSGSGQTAAEVGSDTPSHTHGIGVNGVGDHGFHRPQHLDGSAGSTAQWTSNVHQGGGAHGHTAGSGNASNSHQHYLYIPPHSVTQVVVGANVPFNIECPAFCGNWAIWT